MEITFIHGRGGKVLWDYHEFLYHLFENRPAPYLEKSELTKLEWIVLHPCRCFDDREIWKQIICGKYFQSRLVLFLFWLALYCISYTLGSCHTFFSLIWLTFEFGQNHCELLIATYPFSFIYLFSLSLSFPLFVVLLPIKCDIIWIMTQKEHLNFTRDTKLIFTF